MNEIEKKIIAIGGVGVTPESDKNLDLFILSQLKKTKNDIYALCHGKASATLA